MAPAKNNTRILLIDTSAEYRRLLAKSLEETEDIEIIAEAPNGNIGLLKAREMSPDIILLDASMTDLEPKEFVSRCAEELQQTDIILTVKKANEKDFIDKIIQSLEKGAFDFIEKPDITSEAETAGILKRKLIPKIRAISIRRYSQMAKSFAKNAKINIENKHIKEGANALQECRLLKNINGGAISSTYKMLAIGVSTGGPEALNNIIPLFPANFPLPIIIVMHMPALFTKSMADELNRRSCLSVKEAEDGEIIKEGMVYLAKGGIHLTVAKDKNNQCAINFDNSPPENSCKPSIDIFFKSIPDPMRRHVIALIMTGMGADGVKGIGQLKEHGAKTLAQDEETSLIWGMPGSAVKAGYIDEVISLDKIAQRIIEIISS